jgi:hypothetical protein
MATVWKYFKQAVLVWGFVWLAIILFIVVSVLVQKVNSQMEAAKQSQIDTSFKKTVGDINLKVKKESTNHDKLLVSVAKNNTALVTDFALPSEQYNLNCLDVNDANVFPTNNNAYRVILFSSESESDHDFSHSYIWVLNLNKEMRFEKLFNISDVHKIPGDDSLIYGNLEIDLPDFGKEEFQAVHVPVEVRVGSTISMRPMLNQHSLNQMREHYVRFINGRIAQLTNLKDDVLLKRYKMALQDFEDGTVEKQY